MPPHNPELRVATFNVWVGQSPARLEENLTRLAKDTDRPHVIALQEAKRYNGTIRGYVRHAVAEPGNPEADNCVLLIRKDVTIHRDRDIDVDGPVWVGPKHGLVHPSKDFPALTIGVDGQRWDVVDVHRAWTGGLRRNLGAWRAEHEALIGFADRRHHKTPDRPLVMAGDWNNRASDPRPLGVAALAEHVGGRLLMRGIDGALVRGCTGRAKELGDKYGSDGHHPVVITLTKEKK